jgi:alkylhydroperoxidase family enzyme
MTGSNEEPGAGPWIERIGPEEAQGRLAEVYRTVSRGHPMAHIMEIETLHPAALEWHHRLYQTLMFGPSPLTRAEREAIAVVVSAANDCFY